MKYNIYYHYNSNHNGNYNPFYQNTKLEKHKPKKSPQEGQATAVSKQDQARSIASEDTAQGTLSGYEGPIQSSPYYKSLLATGTDSTTNAYNNAKATSRAKANAAGFGNPNPVEAGAENEINAKETADLASLPTKAIEATAPLQLEAAGETARMGEAQGGQGTANLGIAGNLDTQYQNRMGNFYNTLLKAGTGAFMANPYGIFGQQ